MISYDLKGKTALVTGGASGIGFATARMLAKFGATVAVNFLADDARGPEAVEKINAEGGKAIMAPGSVSEAGNCERMVLKAIDDLGRLDLLFNNAGTPGTQRRIAPPELDLITEELWTLLLQTNLLSVFRGSKAAAPALKAAHGAIVSTASIAGLGRAGIEPRLQCDQGRCGEPHAEPCPRFGTRGAGQCNRAWCRGQLVDGRVDQ